LDAQDEDEVSFPRLEMEGQDMTIDILCPRCGGTTSNYDENKWSCLVCGHKFSYTPPRAPQDFRQTSVMGPDGEEIGVEPAGVVPPTPVFERKSAPESNRFDVSAINERAIRGRALAGSRLKLLFISLVTGINILILGSIIVFGVTAMVFEPAVSWTRVGLLVAIGAGASLFLLRSIRAWCSASTHHRTVRDDVAKLRNRDQQLAVERDEDMVTGHHIVCPYCMSNFEFIGGGSAMPLGLRHCYKCDKEFVTANGYTYPLATELAADPGLQPQPVLGEESQSSYRQSPYGRSKPLWVSKNSACSKRGNAPT
jgi:hypothetical protein